MTDLYPEPHEWQAGDLIEWQGCPVVVLGPPILPHPECKTVSYLAVSDSITVSPGEILRSFTVKDKLRWTKPLTQEQEILFTKLMLGYHG